MANKLLVKSSQNDCFWLLKKNAQNMLLIKNLSYLYTSNLKMYFI